MKITIELDYNTIRAIRKMDLANIDHAQNRTDDYAELDFDRHYEHLRKVLGTLIPAIQKGIKTLQE